MNGMNPDQVMKDKQREIEGQLRIYANQGAALEAIQGCMPLSAMLDKNGSIWIAYRPSTDQFDDDTSQQTLLNWSRSALQLVKLRFNDELGTLVSHLCWFAPISVAANDMLTLSNPQELTFHVNQHLLLLPRLGAGGEYQNMYYAIGSKWTERVRGGAFEQPRLPKELFQDWWSIDRQQIISE
jgi:hypothetical protein